MILLCLPARAQERIVKGNVARNCEWPSVVALQGENLFCTGVLVHPQVVVTAAHCVLPELNVVFGNDTLDLLHTPKVRASCVANERYLKSATESEDFAMCWLESPMTGVPFTPIASMCELEQLDSETKVFQVGFGVSADAPASAFDLGVKRWALSELKDVNVQSNTLVIGVGNEASACRGDSGGPALVQMSDGSWRTIGIASTQLGDSCGSLNRYTWLRGALAWIEEQAGVSVSACAGLPGAPAPAFCGGYAHSSLGAIPGVGVGKWPRQCKEMTTSSPSFAACDVASVVAGADGIPDEYAEQGDGCRVSTRPRGPLPWVVMLGLLGIRWRRRGRCS